MCAPDPEAYDRLEANGEAREAEVVPNVWDDKHWNFVPGSGPLLDWTPPSCAYTCDQLKGRDDV